MKATRINDNNKIKIGAIYKTMKNGDRVTLVSSFGDSGAWVLWHESKRFQIYELWLFLEIFVLDESVTTCPMTLTDVGDLVPHEVTYGTNPEILWRTKSGENVYRVIRNENDLMETGELIEGDKPENYFLSPKIFKVSE